MEKKNAQLVMYFVHFLENKINKELRMRANIMSISLLSIESLLYEILSSK